MNRAPVDNGYQDRALARRPQNGTTEQEGVVGLGDIAKDAIDHVREIVSDSVAIGKLEAKRVIDKAEETAKDVVPRVFIGLMAGAVGFVGVILGLIALFMGLEVVIPSAAVRLAIFAGAFLVLAAAGAFMAARPFMKSKEPKPVVPPVRVPPAERPARLTPPPPASVSH